MGNTRPLKNRGVSVERLAVGTVAEGRFARYCRRMTFVNTGSLGAVPGRRDELVALLIRGNDRLSQVGCLRYDVGVNDDEPDTVFVVELWESSTAHQASLALPEVQAVIAEARPLLSGALGGFRFDVVGSPLDE